jgi:hypothetical protein
MSGRGRRIGVFVACAVAVMCAGGAWVLTADDAAAATPGEAVNGLKLTLAAEKTELAMGADGKVAPTKLTFTFTNVSDKPLKLNTFLLAWTQVKLDVKGPDADSVRKSMVVFKPMAARPKPEDYPIIEPGKSWTAKFQPGFPGLCGATMYALLKPGEYHVSATYTCADADQRWSELAAGCWTGVVTSNEIVLKVAK